MQLALAIKLGKFVTACLSTEYRLNKRQSYCEHEVMASGKSKKRPAPPDFAGSSEATLGGAAKKGKPCNPPPSYKGISPKRCRPLNKIALEDFEGQGNVVYWMSRDQRVQGAIQDKLS